MKIKLLFCCLVFVMTAIVKNASAATCVWTNATGDGLWNTANNWNIGIVLPSHAVPGSTDDVVLNSALLSNYTVTLAGNAQCNSITCNATVLAGSIKLNTAGFSLTTNYVNVGTGSLLSATVLTFLGNGAVTINNGVTLGQGTLLSVASLVGLLNFGSATDASTNVTIKSGATVSLNGPSGSLSLLTGGSLLGLLNGPSIINNYGNLTMTNTIMNFSALGSQFVNYGTGVINTTGSTFNLNYDLAGIVNLGTFNVGTATSTTTNFNYSATSGSNYINNYGTFNAGTSSSVCNFNMAGIPSTLLTANVNLLGILGVTVTILQGSGPSINNYGTFNGGITSSICNIYMTGTSPAVNNATATVNAATSNGAFNLSSVSAIYPTVTSSIIANNSPSCVFTLLSDQNGSATIGQAGTGAVISGQYNVQRFITGNNSITYRGYRLLSSPVNITSATSSATGQNYISLNTLKSSFTVAGTTYPGAFTGGITGPAGGFSVRNNNPTIYFYKEPLSTSNATFTSGKYQGVTSIGTNQVTLTDGFTYNIPVGNSYLFFFIGSTASRTTGTNTIPPDNAYITNVGYINQQNIKMNLWYTPAGGALTLSKTYLVGFNMVGNPYPSTIDLNKVYSDNSTNIGPSFYEFNDANQSFPIYNGSTGATSGVGSSRYVASGQGFHVNALSNSSTLTFNESEKTTVAMSPSPMLLSLKNSRNLALNNAISSYAANLTTPLTGLHLKMQKDSLVFDECGIYYSSAWSDNYDNNDAAYLSGGSQALMLCSLTADGHQVGINSLGSYANGKSTKLYVKGATDGPYSMQLEDLLNIDTANYRVYLRDNFTKDSVNLVDQKQYAFTITNADTTTFGSNRFVLAIEKKPTPPYQLLSFTAEKATGGVLLTWKTSNESNYTNFSIEKLSGASPEFASIYKVQSNAGGVYTYLDHNPSVGTNTYRLAQNDVNNNVVYSNILEVTYNPAASSGLLSVYPNPAKADISVVLNNATNSMSQSNYQANIYNAAGLLVMQKSVNSSSWSQDVSPLRPGSYIMEVRAGNGSVVGNTKFTKN